MGILIRTLFFWFADMGLALMLGHCFFAIRLKKPASVLLLIALTHAVVSLANLLRNQYLNMAVAAVCLYVVLLVYFSASWQKILLLASAYFAIQILCETIALGLWGGFTSADYEQVAQLAYLRTGFMFINRGILFIVITCIRFWLIHRKNKLGKQNISQNYWIILLPICSVALAHYVYEDMSQYGMHSRRHTYMVFFVLLLLVFANVAIFIGQESLYRRAHLKRELHTMDMQQQFYKTMVEDQQQYLDEVMMSAHDFRNHLIYLRGMISNQDELDDKVSQFLGTMEKEMQHIEASYAGVENKALRMILRRTQLRCNINGIAFSTELHSGDLEFIQYDEICTLFGNMLDNALEACLKAKKENAQPLISLAVVQQRGMVRIRCRNTMTGAVIRNENKELLSTKEDAHRHGFGLKNIYRVVEKYKGYLRIQDNADVFELSIGIPV